MRAPRRTAARTPDKAGHIGQDAPGVHTGDPTPDVSGITLPEELGGRHQASVTSVFPRTGAPVNARVRYEYGQGSRCSTERGRPA